jgi:hypothetical protein
MRNFNYITVPFILQIPLYVPINYIHRRIRMKDYRISLNFISFHFVSFHFCNLECNIHSFIRISTVRLKEFVRIIILIVELKRMNRIILLFFETNHTHSTYIPPHTQTHTFR